MKQFTLFDSTRPYKYIIDTSSILSQKDNEVHRRKVYQKLWANIDELIQDKIIVICSEIQEEICDETITKWLSDLQCEVLGIDDEIQDSVIKIVSSYPRLIDFKKLKSSGDAFLIASAEKYDLTVVTEESKNSDIKIPFVCGKLGIPCINILELCEKENWLF